MKKFLIIICWIITPTLVFSQNSFTFNHSWHNDFQKEFHAIDSSHHTSIKAHFNLDQNVNPSIQPSSFKSPLLNRMLNSNALRLEI